MSTRICRDDTLIISDTLYTTDLSTYRPAIVDTSDRLACGNRKRPDYFARVLEERGLAVRDMRIMPSNAEVIHRFGRVRLNIEQHFPDGVTGAPAELHKMAVSFCPALAENRASVYSIICRNAC